MIPPRHRPDEFHLSLAWAPQPGHSPSFPGIYLRAYFANEGEAASALGPARDYREQVLLTPAALNAVLGALSTIEPGLAELAEPLNEAVDKAQRDHYAGMRVRLERLRRETAEAEAALTAAGIDPTTVGGS